MRMYSMCSFVLILFLATTNSLFYCVSSATAGMSDVVYSTVAITGDSASGTGDGVVFSSFESPYINQAGQTAFIGKLEGANVSPFRNDLGIWVGSTAADLTMVVRSGESAPGTGQGINFTEFSNLSLNETGLTAFSASLTGTNITPLTNDQGIWSEGKGAGLTLVARTGNLAPDLAADVVFTELNDPVFNDAGQVAFVGRVDGPGVFGINSVGVFSEVAGSGLTLIARRGDAAPETDSGIAFSNFEKPALNGQGQIVFLAFIEGNDVNSVNGNNRGIWSGTGPDLDLLYRSGSEGPGASTDIALGSIFVPVVNNAGQIAFRTAFAPLDTSTDVFGRGIFSQGNPRLVVASRGSDIAGIPDGVSLSFFGDPIINEAGQTAFLASLSGTGVFRSNDSVLLFDHGLSDVRLIAREGDQAPGTPNGILFIGLGDPVLNGIGQVAFTASLSGDDITDGTDAGIWATDRMGQVGLVVREGQLFDVNDDPLVEVLRVVSRVRLFDISGGTEARRDIFNDASQIVFQLDFTDGSSGIFVATVPEPASLAVLICLGFWLSTRRLTK